MATDKTGRSEPTRKPDKVKVERNKAAGEDAGPGPGAGMVEAIAPGALDRAEPPVPVEAEPGSEPLANPQWEKFCHEYTRPGVDRAEAYENAFGTKGSRASALNASRGLVKKPEVKNRVWWIQRQIFNESFEKARLEYDDIAGVLRDFMTVNMPDLFKQVGDTIQLKRLEEFTPQENRSVKKLKVFENLDRGERRIEVELYDKLEAAKVLIELIKLIKDQDMRATGSRLFGNLGQLNTKDLHDVDQFIKRFTTSQDIAARQRGGNN